MPWPSTHGVSASRLPSSSPLSVYRSMMTMMTRTSPRGLTTRRPNPNPNPGPTRTSDRVQPHLPRRRSSYRRERAHIQAYRRVVGYDRVSLMDHVARLGSHGVSSRYGVPPTKIRGRYVSLSFFWLSVLVFTFDRATNRFASNRFASSVLLWVQSFLTLPDACKVSFVDVDATDLASHLPNLPPSTASSFPHTNSHTNTTTTHAPSPDPVPSPFDLVHRFLVYEPPRRLRPSEALGHPWFRAEPGLVLPADGDSDSTGHDAWEIETGTMTRLFTLEGQTRTLGDLLQMYVASKEC